ncbi:MAG: hypothetical protein JO305_00265 [Alphaproteobacteria bacterium]|nr:hypothetical protein [Alphaproteobacteria bacterium]
MRQKTAPLHVEPWLVKPVLQLSIPGSPFAWGEAQPTASTPPPQAPAAAHSPESAEAPAAVPSFGFESTETLFAAEAAALARASAPEEANSASGAVAETWAVPPEMPGQIEASMIENEPRLIEPTAIKEPQQPSFLDVEDIAEETASPEMSGHTVSEPMLSEHEDKPFAEIEAASEEPGALDHPAAAGSEPEFIDFKPSEPADRKPAEGREPVIAEPEPGFAEPELAEPELAEPEFAEPELVEPELAEPEFAEPDWAEPELAEPESPEPEFAEPELAEPESARRANPPAIAEPIGFTDAEREVRPGEPIGFDSSGDLESEEPQSAAIDAAPGFPSDSEQGLLEAMDPAVETNRGIALYEDPVAPASKAEPEADIAGGGREHDSAPAAPIPFAPGEVASAIENHAPSAPVPEPPASAAVGRPAAAQGPAVGRKALAEPLAARFGRSLSERLQRRRVRRPAAAARRRIPLELGLPRGGAVPPASEAGAPAAERSTDGESDASDRELSALAAVAELDTDVAPEAHLAATSSVLPEEPAAVPETQPEAPTADLRQREIVETHTGEPEASVARRSAGAVARASDPERPYRNPEPVARIPAAADLAEPADTAAPGWSDETAGLAHRGGAIAEPAASGPPASTLPETRGRRLYRRVVLEAEIEVDGLPCRLIDLSVGGFAVGETSAELVSETEVPVALRIALDGLEIGARLRAHLVYSGESRAAGRFVDLNASQTALLRYLVTWRDDHLGRAGTTALLDTITRRPDRALPGPASSPRRAAAPPRKGWFARWFGAR